MKPQLILILALAAGAATAQDIKHEDNGEGLKLSLDGPGAKASATAGGGPIDASSLIPGGISGLGGAAGVQLPEGLPADFLKSYPQPGSGGGHRESTVYLMHNGKSVKVTRRPSRYGGEEVVVTTNDGGKDKVEEMSLAEYERRYLGKKAAKDKARGQEKDQGRGKAKAEAQSKTGDRRLDGTAASGGSAGSSASGSSASESSATGSSETGANETEAKSDASDTSGSGPSPTASDRAPEPSAAGSEVPATPNRATE